jgi:hypothetical protein
LHAPSLSVEQKRDGTDFAYGGGVQFRLGSFAIRAEYQGFDLQTVKDANMISLGATWTFF